MKFKFPVILLVVFLMSACSSTTPTQVETGSVTSTFPSATEVAGTAVPDAATTTPKYTPATAAIPVSTFEKENYDQFTGTVDFNPLLARALNQKIENLEYVDFAVVPDGHNFAVFGCIYTCSPDTGGKFFLAILDLNDPSVVKLVEISPKSRVRDLVFTPSGAYLYYSVGREVFRYELSSNSIAKIYTNNESDTYGYLGVSPDGKLLAISNLVSLKILTLPDLTVTKVFYGSYFGNAQSPEFSKDGKVLILPTKDSLAEITAYDTSTWAPLRVFDTPGMRTSTLSPDGTILAQAYNDPASIKFNGVVSGTELHTISLPFSRVNRMAFNPSGTLLVVTGTPNESAYLEDTIHVIDVGNGVLLGSIPSWTEPFKLWFADGGASILITDYTSSMLEKWSLPNADIEAARAFFIEYFDAITAGDYGKAAQMTALDPIDVEEVQKRGLDPSNLAQAFAVMCEKDEVPCLPPGTTMYVKATKLWGWDYSALVTFTQPDGSTVIFDGLTPYGLMGIKRDDQGKMKINTLHPGMLYPYVE